MIEFIQKNIKIKTMNVITTESLITNYFGENENVSKISLSEIAKLKKEIEKNFLDDGKFVFVDTTIDSIVEAVEGNPKYFSFNDSVTEIIFDRSKVEEFYEDLYGIFNAKIDQEIKYKFLKTFEK